MVTLATAVNATEEDWDLSGPLAATTKYLLVESELVEVVTRAVRVSQREDPLDKCHVLRNRAGTAASHAQGTELTELTSTPLGAGGGGGSGPIGPFHIAHDTPGIVYAGEDTGVAFLEAAIAPGVLVTDVGLRVTEAWVGITGSGSGLFVTILPTADAPDWGVTAAQYLAASSDLDGLAEKWKPAAELQAIAFHSALPTGVGAYTKQAVLALVDCILSVFITSDTAVTAGEADIYLWLTELPA